MMERTLYHKRFLIRAYEPEAGHWRAESGKPDGSELSSLPIVVDCITAEDAIKLAKQAIDAGKLR